MKKFRAIAVFICVIVFFASCAEKPVEPGNESNFSSSGGADMQIDDLQDDARFAHTIASLSNNDVLGQSLHTKIYVFGEYIFYLEGEDFRFPDKLVRIRNDGTNKKTVYQSKNTIGAIQVISRENLCIGEYDKTSHNIYDETYIQFNLLTGETTQIFENPNQASDELFLYPYWVGEYMFFTMLEPNKGQGVTFSSYRKNPNGTYTCLTAHFHGMCFIEKQRLYYTNNLEYELTDKIYFCDFNGRNHGEILLNVPTQFEVNIYEDYVFYRGNDDLFHAQNIYTGNELTFSQTKESGGFLYVKALDDQYAYCYRNLTGALFKLDYLTGAITYLEENASIIDVALTEEWIYYTAFLSEAENDSTILYRIRKDGSDKQQLTGLED